jgi:hypothetical protein
MSLVYIDKVSTNRPNFENKVIQVSKNLQIDPNWLMIVMRAESNLDHTAIARCSGCTATGLIQFTSGTRKWLGTTQAELIGMSNVQQMYYVEKYFRDLGFIGKMNSVYDVYFAVFAPAYVGKADSRAVYSSPTAAYFANKPLDGGKDGVISVGDVKKWFSKYVPETVVPDQKQKYNLPEIPFVGFLAATVLLVIIKKKLSYGSKK